MIKLFRNDCIWSPISFLILEIFQGGGYVNVKVCQIAQEWEDGKTTGWKHKSNIHMVSMIEFRMRTVINLVVYNFRQLAEVQLELHGLEQYQYLLPIRLMQFEQIYQVIDNDIKNAYFYIRVILNTVRNKMP